MIKPIPGWEDRYSADEDGNIYSMKTGRPIHQELNPVHNRYQVKLWRNLRVKTSNVSVLVCSAFHGPKPKGMETSHLDGDRLNNRPDNLVWETRRDNLARRIAHGTDDRGLKNSRACLTEAQVRTVRAEASRGTSYSELMRLFGVSRATISRVVTKKRYQDVT